MNKESPLISVIVPCYKVEQYLARCIDSILRQTYKHLEIILVDDGSPDRCGEICDDYAKRDPRIVVIHKENGGLSDARNVAIDQAKGVWITFVDSDDLVNDDYVDMLYYLVLEYECDCSVCLFKTFREGEEPVWYYGIPHQEMMQPRKAVEQMFYQEKFDNNAHSKLYHRRLFESGIRFPKGRVFEDLAITYQLLLQSNGVAYMDATLYHYLLRDDSIEGSYSPKKVEDGLAVLQSIEANMDMLKGIERAYRCRKFSFLLHLLLAMPKDAIHYKEMVGIVKRIRLSVLFDSHARKKARVAALLSYFGMDFMKWVFSFVNQRKYNKVW
jgi:Glycosyltransferases involved in cell wall biogenesis